MNDQLLDFLDQSPWRGCLTEAQWHRVRDTCALRKFDAGAVVCLRGSPAMHWLGVVDGMLKVDTIAEDGRTTTFAGVPAGAWFGEGAALKGEPRPYAVTAIRNSAVAFIPAQTFQWLIDESRPFSRWVIDQLNARLAHYISLVESFRFDDVTGRVAHCLAELFNPHLYPATTRELAISQDEIARLCGLARQNTNRALKKLEEASLLEIRYGVVVVLDVEGLHNFSTGA